MRKPYRKVGKVERNYLRLMYTYWLPAIGVVPEEYQDPDKPAQPNPEAADIVLNVLRASRELFGLDKAIEMEVSSTAASDFAPLLGAIHNGEQPDDDGREMNEHPRPDLEIPPRVRRRASPTCGYIIKNRENRPPGPIRAWQAFWYLQSLTQDSQ